MLSDRTIRAVIARGDISVDPFPIDVQFQPVSIDLRLGAVDVDLSSIGLHDMLTGEKTYCLKPQQFALASTKETVGISSNVAATVHGKSTWARRGLQVHAAGLVDPGFKGQLTLELFNMSPHEIWLVQGETIAQISFTFLSCTPDRPYGSEGLDSHYQGQTGPTPAHGYDE